jgi:hypothetical protein
VLLLATAQTSDAAQYRLQVANLEEMLFFRYVETQGAPLRAERHVLPRLEAELDRTGFPVRAILSDYTVQPVAPMATVVGQFEPVVLSVTSPQHSNPWMVASWEGLPGKTVLLQLSGYQANYQELVAVAVNTNGVLRRLPVQGIPLFGSRKLLAPAVSSNYLDHALERGAFGSLASKHATSLDGLSVVVGRNHDPQYPDTVYLLVQMPPGAKTYKIALAWKNRDELENDSDDDQGRR